MRVKVWQGRLDVVLSHLPRPPANLLGPHGGRIVGLILAHADGVPSRRAHGLAVGHALGAGSTVAATIDALRQMIPPAQALRRIFVVEVMGRYCRYRATPDQAGYSPAVRHGDAMARIQTINRR